VTAVLEILEAREQDVDHIMTFIQELADYEREPDAVIATHDDLHRALFNENPNVFAVVCWEGGSPIGFALYFFNFSTWLGRNGLYLEDLYVTPSHRGKGAGKQLLSHLANIAVKKGCVVLNGACWIGISPPLSSTSPLVPSRSLNGPLTA